MASERADGYPASRALVGFLGGGHTNERASGRVRERARQLAGWLPCQSERAHWSWRRARLLALRGVERRERRRGGKRSEGKGSPRRANTLAHPLARANDRESKRSGVHWAPRPSRADAGGSRFGLHSSLPLLSIQSREITCCWEKNFPCCKSNTFGRRIRRTRAGINLGLPLLWLHDSHSNRRMKLLRRCPLQSLAQFLESRHGSDSLASFQLCCCC